MTATISRKELHTMIDTIPDHSIPVIIPILSYLSNDYWKPVIEYATPEEAAMIDERMQDYENDPSSFSPLKY